MPVHSSASNNGPASWRALFNEVFGIERWSIVLTYNFSSGPNVAAMPKLHVVSVPRRVCHIVIQEWPDGGFSYFLETRFFDATDCRRQLEMWRDNLI